MSGVGFLDGRTRNQKRHVWRDGRWVLRLTHYQQIPFDSDDRQHQHFNRMGIGGNMRETTFKILTQGDVQMAHCQGYMVAGGEDAVCFYIDPRDRAYISASTESDSGCPVVYVSRDDCERDTEIEFSEFKGWRFHAGGDGKAIAVALVRRAADDA